MKIWVDDQYEERKGWFDPEWVHVRWPQEAIAYLKKYNNNEWVDNAMKHGATKETAYVTHISLDHDLGDGDNAKAEDRREITGYDVTVWIEEQVKTNRSFIAPEISIHSQNAVGQDRMKASIKQIGVYLSERG